MGLQSLGGLQDWDGHPKLYVLYDCHPHVSSGLFVPWPYDATYLEIALDVWRESQSGLLTRPQLCFADPLSDATSTSRSLSRTKHLNRTGSVFRSFPFTARAGNKRDPLTKTISGLSLSECAWVAHGRLMPSSRHVFTGLGPHSSQRTPHSWRRTTATSHGRLKRPVWPLRHRSACYMPLRHLCGTGLPAICGTRGRRLLRWCCSDRFRLRVAPLRPCSECAGVADNVARCASTASSR